MEGVMTDIRLVRPEDAPGRALPHLRGWQWRDALLWELTLPA
jgi:hypothetical protein